MADAYLNVAERVIAEARRPLKPGDIIRLAYGAGYVPWHLHGARQDKTLHARLSEDISRNPEASVFYRTAAGEFFLQRLRSDPEIPSAYKRVYHAPPRRRELRRDWILAVDLAKVGIAAERAEYIPLHSLTGALARDNFGYYSWDDLESRPTLASVHSFVVVWRAGEVLSYRVGKFSPESDPLYGRRSIGLGGHVYASDDDLFDDSLGIISSGILELSYGIGLPRRLSERARYEKMVRPLFGIRPSKDRGKRSALYVVLTYKCPDEFSPTSGALSVNDLRWLRPRNPGNAASDFDEVSATLLGRHLPELCRVVDK